MQQTSIDLPAFRSSALSNHNTYRATHHSPSMTISESLNSTAQTWAEHLAANAVFEHSDSSQRNDAGENIYVSYTTESSIDSAELGKSAVEDWYKEVSAYDYNNPESSSGTGHFTQVVWKNSTELGCGAAQGIATIDGTKFNAFYVVCQYAPAGNMEGEYASNVLEP
ncbi:CAP family protein [Aerosakkonemataceae cyanobacterium BLCC-F50]|uniref:CAP family protein n=1 Tax=Floridaenema flaviceps BLCC-F50 TaxID=3153642 RepID=A0ABV4XPH2_9CYAN